MADDDLVRAALVENEAAAEIALSMLETEGIKAIWHRTDLASEAREPGASAGAGGVEILVLPADAERAIELLK
jgi:Putative prokaryotic signal transducing protein